MRKVRLIARLDIKGENVIKGIHLEGLRVVGSPSELAQAYYAGGADELLYMDSVASLYGRNKLRAFIENAARNIFIPMTVGGGVRSVEDAMELLYSGADKVAVNTAAITDPSLITTIARRFGSQCMVLSVEAKQVQPGHWEAYTHNGRNPTGRDVVEWCKEAISRGAGEILLTSVDREGTKKGLDLVLTRAITKEIAVPVIASGGAGTPGHVVAAACEGGADAVAVASILHYRQATIADIRRAAQDAGIDIRADEHG